MNKRIGVGDWRCSPRERELINEVLDSGRLSYGPKSKEFERRFAEIHDARYGILSNSGTSSLQVALQAAKELHGWKDGSEVIVPATTFVATINVILHNKLKPVLAPIRGDTYNIHEIKTPELVTKKTVAIIPVHLFGQSVHMSYLRMFLPPRLVIIEDACEAAFAKHKNYPVGSWGDIGCFSFYVAHLLTTGVGGMAVTDNPDYAVKMRSLVNHGRDGIYLDIDTEATKEVIERRFKFESVGHSYRITELEAALGLAQLDGWEAMIEKRRHNATLLTKALANKPLFEHILLPITRADNKHSWMMYPIVCKRGNKWPLINHLEERGIETRELLPLINQPVYQKLVKEQGGVNKFGRSQFLIDGGFYVGCHQGLDDNDMLRIADAIGEFYNGKG